MEDEIKGIVAYDDKNEFISFMNNPVRNFNPFYTRRSNVLEWICLFNSLNCGTALLESKTILQADLNYLLKGGRYLLHIVF